MVLFLHVLRKLINFTISTLNSLAMPATLHTWDDWHKILAHANIQAIQTMKRKGLVEGLDVNDTIAPDIQCTSCIQAKQHVQPFPQHSVEKSRDIGDLTYSDIWGLA